MQNQSINQDLRKIGLGFDKLNPADTADALVECGFLRMLRQAQHGVETSASAYSTSNFFQVA